MGVIYSGQTIINTTLDGSTNDTLNRALKDALISVGWTLIKDGTGDGIWRVRCAATPQGMQGDMWLWRGVSGTPVPSLFAASSLLATTNTTTGYQEQNPITVMVGTGYTYQLIAGAYYFYLFRAATPMPAQQCFFFTAPFVPPNLVGMVTSIVCGYGSNSNSDTIGNGALFQTGSNAFAYLNGSGSTRSGQLSLYGVQSVAKPTWFDSSCEYYEPRVMAFQTSGSGGQAGSLRACGYQWDALVINQAIPRGTMIPYDGGTWLVITEGTDPGLMVKIA
jgi:hypothetical protein